MRSTLGTQSRLAAHIAALFLLILMLVYLAPSPELIAARRNPPPLVEASAVMPAAEPVAEPAAAPEPVVTEAPAAVEESAAATAVPAVEPAPEPVAEPVPAPAEDAPVPPQPDESGALVVAPAETGASEKVAAPLKNANLEVLGDGVYWLSARHDLEKELAAIPEIANLIVLAPLPGHTVAGFEHVKTDVIPADAADLTGDAADQFLHLASKGPGPVVAAALPGARGAAFFKAAYLLRGRNLTGDEVLREIEPELEEAGSSREEVLHRLLRLAGGAKVEVDVKTEVEPAPVAAPAE